MLNLKSVVSDWGNESFPERFKNTVEKLGVNELPLQQGLSLSNIALDDNVKVIILNCNDLKTKIEIKAGLFYTGMIAGCNCFDDPSPIDLQNEYCEVMVAIELSSGDTSIFLLDA